VRVDLHEREVPEREADTDAHFLLDPLDRSKRLAREGAFVVAVLEDQTTFRRAADMVDRRVEWLDGGPPLVRNRVACHQSPITCE
jgi:hypothetical protein